MSLEAFLAEVDKPESSGGGSTFTDVAKARVFFCWQGWTNNTSQVFEYEANNDESSAKARNQCQEYIDSGANEYDQWPHQGICTHIFGDWIPTNAEGEFHWGDILDFVKKYESDKNSSKLTDDEKKLVTGPMPFNLVVEGIRTNPSVFGHEQYVKMSQEVNQWSKAKGKKNKKGYDKRVYVIQHVYKDKAEAEADAEAINTGIGQVSSQPQAANIELSSLAIEKWGQEGVLSKEQILEGMKTQKGSIENFIQNLQKGIGVRDGKKLSVPDAQETAANGHGMERSDLPLIGIKDVEIAF